MDPHLHNESLTSAVLANVYDGLTELDHHFGIRAALAAGWSNPDEKTWVFRIRPAVAFHDGRPLTAGDVVFSLERARHHPESGLASYLVEVESVREIDPLTVEVRTRRPFAPLLAKLTPVYIVPRGAPSRIEDPVGTGPYRLVQSGGEFVRMVPAERDWRGGHAGAPLTFVVEPRPDERLRLLLSGEVDVAADLDEIAVKVLEKVECCSGLVRPGSAVEYLHLGASDPRFDDRRVRRALHLALARPALVARTLEGWGEAASQLASPGTVGFAPTIRAPVRDVPEARRLLAEAGHPRGFSVTLDFREDRRAEEIQRQLAEAGIEVTLRPGAWADVLGRVRSGEAHFYYGAFTADTGDAGDILDSALHTPEPAAGLGVDNHFGYSSPDVDRLLLAARNAPTLPDRRQALQRVMKQVMADLPMIPLVVPHDLYVVRRDVRWTPRLDGRVLAADLARAPEGRP